MRQIFARCGAPCWLARVAVLPCEILVARSWNDVYTKHRYGSVAIIGSKPLPMSACTQWLPLCCVVLCYAVDIMCRADRSMGRGPAADSCTPPTTYPNTTLSCQQVPSLHFLSQNSGLSDSDLSQG